MLDRAATNDPTAVPATEPVNGQADGSAASLEQRVRRLEDSVAQLQDSEQTEERLVSRVAERVTREAPVALAQPAEPPAFPSRSPHALLPTFVTTIDAPAAQPVATWESTSPTGRRSWGVFDLLAELRTFWRMHVDPRYPMTWMGRVVPGILVAAIITSWFWLPFALALDKVSTTVATIYVKLADLVLAFFLYKVLIREARRYRDAFPETQATPPRPYSRSATSG